VLPGSSYIYKEPQGVVLIISPWNYPVNLALVPLIGKVISLQLLITHKVPLLVEILRFLNYLATARTLARPLPIWFTNTWIDAVLLQNMKVALR
jgi:hypothetical protein